MHKIICPHCLKAFKIDEAGYADILKQVHDKEFDKQLHDRLVAAEKEKQIAVELAESRAMGEVHKTTASKDAEIQALKSQVEAGELAKKHAVIEALNSVEKERDSLKAELASKDMAQKIAVTDAVNSIEKERDQLKNGLLCRIKWCHQ